MPVVGNGSCCSLDGVGCGSVMQPHSEGFIIVSSECRQMVIVGTHSELIVDLGDGHSHFVCGCADGAVVSHIVANVVIVNVLDFRHGWETCAQWYPIVGLGISGSILGCLARIVLMDLVIVNFDIVVVVAIIVVINVAVVVHSIMSVDSTVFHCRMMWIAESSSDGSSGA